MNLENKAVTIEMMSVTSYPENTDVVVAVSEEILPGVFKQIGKFTLKFDQVFHTTSDPDLLRRINEKLLSIPE